MQTNENINELAKTIHVLGMYNDKAPTKVEAFLLVQLQLFKAYEMRNKLWSATEKLIGRMEVLSKDKEHPKMSQSTFQRLYHVYIENSIQGYVANAVMLLMDYAAYKGITIEWQKSEYKDAKYQFADFKTILLDMTAALQFLYGMKITTIEISDLIFYLEEFAKFNNFDLWQLVRFAIHYNNLNLITATAKKNTLKKLIHE